MENISYSQTYLAQDINNLEYSIVSVVDINTYQDRLRVEVLATPNRPPPNGWLTWGADYDYEFESVMYKTQNNEWQDLIQVATVQVSSVILIVQRSFDLHNLRLVESV